MIVVKIIGGLGNQLFQYALGRHLATKNNTNLFLDIRAFDDYYTLHKYALQHFGIKAQIATEKELKAFEHLKNPFSRVARKIGQLFSTHGIIVESEFDFNPEILNLKGNFYLDGYWQSEKYFVEMKSTIENELTVQTPLSDKTRDILTKVKSLNSASIHIRRGDYVSNSQTNAVHGVCDLAYYDRAMKNLESRANIETYFVFSDDIKWAENNLTTNRKTVFVDHNDALTNYEDLLIMSKCKHQIIANSSFSWWAAWLNKNLEKIVIAPQKWYSSAERSSYSVIPSDWTRSH